MNKVIRSIAGFANTKGIVGNRHPFLWKSNRLLFRWYAHHKLRVAIRENGFACIMNHIRLFTFLINGNGEALRMFSRDDSVKPAHDLAKVFHSLFWVSPSKRRKP